jgi:hypothetical protein
MSVPWITAFAILWLLVMLLGFSVVGVMRRAIAVLERAERQPTLDLGGVKPLTRLPRFQLLNDAGETVMSDQLLQETTLLVFMEAGCKPCRALARSLDGADREVAGMPLVIVLDDRGEVEEFALPADVPVFRQRSGAVSRLFESTVSPHAFVIDEAGVVLDRLVPGSMADLELLARRQRTEDAASQRLRVGRE